MPRDVRTHPIKKKTLIGKKKTDLLGGRGNPIYRLELQPFPQSPDFELAGIHNHVIQFLKIYLYLITY